LLETTRDPGSRSLLSDPQLLGDLPISLTLDDPQFDGVALLGGETTELLGETEASGGEISVLLDLEAVLICQLQSLELELRHCPLLDALASEVAAELRLTDCIDPGPPLARLSSTESSPSDECLSERLRHEICGSVGIENGACESTRIDGEAAPQ